MVMCLVNGVMRDIGELYDPEKGLKWNQKKKEHKMIVARLFNGLKYMALMYDDEADEHYIEYGYWKKEKHKMHIDDMLDIYDLWQNGEVPCNIKSLEAYASKYGLPMSFVDELGLWWHEMGNDAYTERMVE